MPLNKYQQARSQGERTRVCQQEGLGPIFKAAHNCLHQFGCLREEVPEDCCWVLPSSFNKKKRRWEHRFKQFTAKAIARAARKLGITGLTQERPP